MAKVSTMKFTAQYFLSIWIILIGLPENASSQVACIQTPCSSSSDNKDSVGPYLRCNASTITIADVKDKVHDQSNRTVLDAVKKMCMGQTSCQLEEKVCPRHSNLVVYYECVDVKSSNKFHTIESRCLNDISQEGSSSSKGASTKPNLTEILIILLSIVSGISIVLSIILIVFCIRWRNLQLQGSEPLYNYQDISPGLQAHYEYISSLEPELDKNRPELVDGYFEVADALPALERGATPTSPAYAEVEQVAQMRRLIFPDESESLQADSSDGTYSLVTSGLGVPFARQDKIIIYTEDGSKKDGVYYELNSRNSSLTDIPSKAAGARPKKTVLERLKGVPGIAFGERDKKLRSPGDVSPKLYNTRNNHTPSARSVLKGKTCGASSARQKIGRLFGSREDIASRDIPDTTSEAGSEPAYEIVEEFVPLSVSKQNIKAKINNDSQQQKPVIPPSGSFPGGRHRWPNQKVSTKQQDSQICKSTSPLASQKQHFETNSEKLPIDKKERCEYLNNQKSKVAFSPKPVKPKSAKSSSTIPPHVNSSAATDKEQECPTPIDTQQKSSSKGSAFPSSKAEIKKKNTPNLTSDSSGTKNNNYKPTGLKDLPCSKGIVKNGIQKFEQSSSTSNE